MTQHPQLSPLLSPSTPSRARRPPRLPPRPQPLHSALLAWVPNPQKLKQPALQKRYSRAEWRLWREAGVVRRASDELVNVDDGWREATWRWAVEGVYQKDRGRGWEGPRPVFLQKAGGETGEDKSTFEEGEQEGTMDDGNVDEVERGRKRWRQGRDIGEGEDGAVETRRGHGSTAAGHENAALQTEVEAGKEEITRKRKREDKRKRKATDGGAKDNHRTDDDELDGAGRDSRSGGLEGSRALTSRKRTLEGSDGDESGGRVLKRRKGDSDMRGGAGKLFDIAMR